MGLQRTLFAMEAFIFPFLNQLREFFEFSFLINALIRHFQSLIDAILTEQSDQYFLLSVLLKCSRGRCT